MLQTARSQEFCTPAGQAQGLKNLKYGGIDGLIVIGGDGSLRGAHVLHQRKFPVVGIPASINEAGSRPRSNACWRPDSAYGPSRRW